MIMHIARKPLSLTFLLIFHSFLTFALTVDATDISDEKYFPAVHQELTKAKESIYVAMYEVYVDPTQPESPPYILLQDLINAHQRDLKVKVYLDRSIPFGELSHLEGLQAKNETAYYLLQKAGVDVQYIKPSKRLHDKLIVIDQETVISGSTNWSYSSLKRNSESADLIHSKEYAQIKLANLAQLETLKEPFLSAPPAYIYKLKVSNEFLKNSRLASRMVNRSQGTLFDLYLFLIKTSQDKNSLEFSIDYAKTAPVVNLDPNHWRSKYEIHRLLNRLAKEYPTLISIYFKRETPPQIKLPPSPTEGYFNIPYAYWDYGWERRLSLRAKFMYLVNIYKQETSFTKPWWSLGRELLSEDFHIHPSTIRRGMRELENLELIQVKRGRIEPGGSFEDKSPNAYLLRSLLSPEEIEENWKTLEETYGRGLVKDARALAKKIDAENSFQATEEPVRLITIYGYDWTEAATRITARLAVENPARYVWYVEGILERWSKQGYPDN